MRTDDISKYGPILTYDKKKTVILIWVAKDYKLFQDLALEDVESRLKNFDYTSPNVLADELNKAIDDAAGNILKFLDIVQYSHGNGEETTQLHNTELDLKQLALQKEEIVWIYFYL